MKPEEIHANFLESYASSMDEILLVLARDRMLSQTQKIMLMEKFLVDVDTIVNYRLKKVLDDCSYNI